MKAIKQAPCIRELSKSIAEALRSAQAATRMRSAKGVRPSIIRLPSGGLILGAALAVAPAHRALAQDQQGQGRLEEITVTGSRIPRRDFTANAPITTIPEATFKETGAIGVETVLNQLPQFVPAVTQFTTFDTEQTATNTVGASTISLRGLGPNRNLVLIDGKRAMPVNPTMVVDTNSIPAAAIERVEVISGGASAVYGADAVGGVVNFILKDDFEGANVDVRLGDTEHGGSEEVTISALIGANVSGGRGNVMLGVEKATRSKVYLWQRDWRLADYANPSVPGTQIFPTETWIGAPWAPNGIYPSFNVNYPDQQVVNQIFSEAEPCTSNPDNVFGHTAAIPGVNCPTDANGYPLGVPNNAQIYINRTPDGTGTVFAGIGRGGLDAAGAYRYQGPYDVDNYGQFPGLPFRVVQPDGNLKENTWYQLASIPLERLSSFGKGTFGVSDNVRLVGQALFTRTQNITALGATSDTIGVWGAQVPYGTNIYEPSVNSFGADGVPNTGDAGEDMTTRLDYLPGGRYQLACPSMGGCTESQAWPLPPEVQTLLNSRADPEQDVWVNRTQDALRYVLGDARGSRNETTTLQLSLGAEGELANGKHSWDVTFSTGRTDVQNTLTGSIRLTTYRELLASPNFGVGFVGDPNPASDGFAEGRPSCTTGMPITRDFIPSQDCIEMLHAPLQNQTAVTQNVFEANIVGNLLEMHAGSLGYALGASYRENSYTYTPDNLIRNGSTADAIAGVFPNTGSGGKFDVSEIYGELLIPVIADGPAGVKNFSFELGGRVSDWSVEQVGKVGTYKALVDWTIMPKFRLRGGFNRALRAPNLGELYVGRSQVFDSLASIYNDQCSQNAQVGPFSGNPSISSPEQAAQTVAICRQLMGSTGAVEYYDNRPLTQQPTGVGFFGGSAGIQNSFGNPDVHEEQADTFTLGMVMDLLQNWNLTLDYYSIELKDMIALESPDSVYESCLSIEKNPTGDPTALACQQIERNPINGSASNINLTFTNQGRAKVEGVDLQLNWNKMLAGGNFNMNLVANYNISSETQDKPDATTYDWAGTTGCGLQIQCQQYDYRLFTTLTYLKGNWSITLRNQYWPSVLDPTFAKGVTGPTSSLGNIDEDYTLVYLGGSYAFGDKYTLRFGIDNLFDKDPPLAGGDPNASPFPIPQTHVISAGRGGFGAGGSSVYEPLGRRGFVSMTMNF
jgi:outer membrane receptor protein involved in Fe transport